MKHFRDSVRLGISVTFLAAILLGALPASAERWMVPAAANVAGSAGTNWRTDLRIANTEDTPISARIHLLPTGADNGQLDRFVDVTVPADGQVEIGNVLASRFSFSGTAALLIEEPGDELLVSSRTYNQVPGGTYGQFIPGVPTDLALAPGQIGHLIFLSKSSDFRTNFGFAGTSSTAGSVTVTLYGADGSVLGSGTYQVGPYGQDQINDIFGAVGAPARAVARATVTSTVPVVAYASVVDNRTGDPVAVLAQLAPTEPTDLLLPGVARASGVGSSLWRTDLRIHTGGGGGGGKVSLAYHPRNSAVANPTTEILDVIPGELLALDDVMWSVFGMSTANGGLRISADVPVLVVARTYNQSSTGTYGQSIPANPMGQLLQAGDSTRMSGVVGGDFRTNALFFNGGSSPTQVGLELLAADGSLAALGTTDLSGGETDQINNLLGYFGVQGDDGPYTLRVLTVSGGPVAAAVSVIDSQSDDPTYESPLQLWLGTGGGGGGGGGGGSGACVTLSYPSPGTVASYEILGEFEGSTFLGEMVRTYHSAGPTGSHDTAVVTFEMMGVAVSIETETRDSFRILSSPLGHGEWLASDSEVSGDTGGFPIPISSYEVTYSPPQYVGPFERWCDGETWVSPSVSAATVTTPPGTTTTEPTAPYEGVVESVNEAVTTPAGTFVTARSRTEITGGDGAGGWTRQWVSIDDGVLVKEEVYEPGGELIGSLELIDLD